jgi:predicted nucleic acid-binding protein
MMAERRWVINASPLILLGKVGKLGLLEPLVSQLRIPDAVKSEIERGDAADAARIWVGTAARNCFASGTVTDPTVAAWGLGAGETAVLSYARTNSGFTAVIDDLQARECALSLGLPLQGTLGILLLAKKQGLLQQVRPVMQELRANDMRLSGKLIDKVLQLAGEKK